MSLSHYLFNDTCNGLGAFDRFFDGAFHPRALLRVQDRDSVRPRMDVHYDNDTNNVNNEDIVLTIVFPKSTDALVSCCKADGNHI